MKHTKHKLLSSIATLFVCLAMFIGSTYAWFTDSASTGINKIQAGNLDVELYHKTDGTEVTTDSANKVDTNTTLFKKDLWEPGSVVYENLLIQNAGNLAFKYQMGISSLVAGKNFNYLIEARSAEGVHTTRTLMDVLYVYQYDGTLTQETARSLTAQDGILLKTYLDAGLMSVGQLKSGESKKFGLAIYWPQSAIDNDYNVNNGRTTTSMTDENDATISNSDKQLMINFPITVNATQYTYEKDSFDDQYDKNAGIDATWGGITTIDSSIEVTAGEDNRIAVSEGTTELASVTVPGSELGGITELNLTVTKAETEIANPVVTISAGNNSQTFDVELVDQDGNKVTSSSDPMKVTLNIGVVDLQEFYHKGTLLTSVNSESGVDAVGEYYYNSTTGIVTYMTNSFSPFTAVYKYDGGLGTETQPYIIASSKAWIGLASECKDDSTYVVTEGKYYELITNLDLSSYDGIQANIQHFAGHFNMGGNSIVGLNGRNAKRIDNDGNTCIFNKISGNATIENMNFNTYTLVANDGTIGNNLGGQVALQLTGYIQNNGKLTLKDIRIEGFAMNNGSNNVGLLSYGYGAGTYVFENCDNYSTLVSTKRASAYFGSISTTSKNISFKNCNNYGNIISTSSSAGAGMFISNGTCYGATAQINISFEGSCKNYGNIISAYTDSSIPVANYGDGYKTVYKFNGLSYSELLNNKTLGGIIDNNIVELTTSQLQTENGYFILQPIENAVRYDLTFSFSAGGTHHGGGAGYVLSFVSDLPNNIIVGDWITKSEAEEMDDEIIIHNEYGNPYYTCGNHYVFYEEDAAFLGDRRNVFVSFVAYDENNIPVSISTFTYNQ